MDPELPPAVSQLLASDPERFSRPLTHEEGLFLLYGPTAGEAYPFESELAAVAMWFVHRRLLMASYLGSGRRPIAWHVIEHPTLPWKGRDRERSILFNAGLLEPAERDALVADWRRAFDAAQHRDEAARREAAYAAEDIPLSLVRKWTAELRSRQKAARRLSASSRQRSVSLAAASPARAKIYP